ncbi:MAG: 50S ribosomal protein L1 [Thermoplasmata archaeon]|nr:50S ribosomal protein L1 [Thermoplasmata archaeon]
MSDYINILKELISSSPSRNFKETVELAINLKDIDLSLPRNRIEEEVVLPKGRGRQVKIAVFATTELAMKAKDVADMVIRDEEIDDIAGDRRAARKLANQHAFFLAEAPLMPIIGKKLGIVLGPRGKMPRPIPPGMDPSGIINTLRNTVKMRSKDRRTFHVPIGTREMSPEDLAENLNVILKRIMSRLDRGKQNIASIYVKTTMGHSKRIM